VHLFTKGYIYTEKPEMFDWLSDYKATINAGLIGNSNNSPDCYYLYPASPAWWNYLGGSLPPFNKRTAVLKGDDIKTVAINTFGNGHTLTHTNSLDVDGDVIIVSLEDAPATTVYGKYLNDHLDELLKEKTIIIMGYRKNLGAMPNIDKYYKNEFPLLTTVQAVNPPAGATILKTTGLINKPYAFNYGNLWIFADSSWADGNIKYITDYNFHKQTTMKKPNFKDDKNNFIGALKVGNISSVLTIDNDNEVITNSKMIAVLSNGDKRSTFFKEIPVIPKTANFMVEFPLTITSNGEKVSFYLWNNLSSIVPITNKQ